MQQVGMKFRRLQMSAAPVVTKILESKFARIRILQNLILFTYGGYKSFEATPMSSVKEYVPAGTTVIDVGAHFGYFTTRFSRLVGANGEVIALEPNSASCRLLHDRITRARLKNVRVLSCAAWSSSTDVQLLIGGPLEATSRVVLEPDMDGMKVQGRTLHPIVREHAVRRVSFIKIDVEGAEVEVLKGAVETLQRHRPAVLCEIGHESQESSSESVTNLFEILRLVNYDCLDVTTKRILNADEVSSAVARLRYVDVFLCPTKPMAPRVN